MRLAYELAFSNAIIFCKSSVRFIALDDIIFKEPVSIGSLLCLKSQIVYADGISKSFQVSVQADVLDPHTGTRRTTNIFHFSFMATKIEYLPSLMPQSYAESMRFIEGKRRRERWLKLADCI